VRYARWLDACGVTSLGEMARGGRNHFDRAVHFAYGVPLAADVYRQRCICAAGLILINAMCDRTPTMKASPRARR